MKCTVLLKYIWSLKKEGIILTINWRIVKKVYNKTLSYYYKLCLTEEVFIIQSLDDIDFLNKRSSFKLC